MRRDDYRRMLTKLNSRKDIEHVKAEFCISEEALLSILSHKISRDATRRFYQVKHRARYLLKDWLKGETLPQIAERLNFPPVLTAKIVLEEHGIGRKTCNDYLRKPEVVKNERLRRELADVVANDIAYSPDANQMQAKYGKLVEDHVRLWLNERSIEYRRENDIKNLYPKTPDFLLKEPMEVAAANNVKINWIECKASFGDEIEMRRNYRRQLKPYNDLFGRGIVVYWYGFLEDVPFEGDMFTVTSDFFEKGIMPTQCREGPWPAQQIQQPQQQGAAQQQRPPSTAKAPPQERPQPKDKPQPQQRTAREKKHWRL